MPLLLTLLSILSLIVVAGTVIVRFWARVTKMLERDEQSIYGESLTSLSLRR